MKKLSLLLLITLLTNVNANAEPMKTTDKNRKIASSEPSTDEPEFQFKRKAECEITSGDIKPEKPFKIYISQTDVYAQWDCYDGIDLMWPSFIESDSLNFQKAAKKEKLNSKGWFIESGKHTVVYSLNNYKATGVLTLDKQNLKYDGGKQFKASLLMVNPAAYETADTGLLLNKFELKCTVYKSKIFIGKNACTPLEDVQFIK